MSNTSTYPLRLPTLVKAAAEKLAKEEGVSLNQFVATAVAEKLSAMNTAAYFAEHKECADFEAFRAILTRQGGELPKKGMSCFKPSCCPERLAFRVRKGAICVSRIAPHDENRRGLAFGAIAIPRVLRRMDKINRRQKPVNSGIVSLPTRLSRSKCKLLILYDHISGMLLGNAFRRGGHSANPPLQPTRPRAYPLCRFGFCGSRRVWSTEWVH